MNFVGVRILCSFTGNFNQFVFPLFLGGENAPLYVIGLFVEIFWNTTPVIK
jgi:hypothetical protein